MLQRGYLVFPTNVCQPLVGIFNVYLASHRVGTAIFIFASKKSVCKKFYSSNRKSVPSGKIALETKGTKECITR